MNSESNLRRAEATDTRAPASYYGRQRGLSFILPDDWTAEQALAVIELLDDLRERICTHDQIPIHDLLREQCAPTPDPELRSTDVGDPPF